MNGFFYKNELYLRVVPGKNLFKSSMIHEVVNRGDIFAVRVRDSSLTIIPGKSEVVHCNATVTTDMVQLELPI